MRLESIHPNYFLGINSHVFVCLALSHIQLCIPMDCSLPGSSVHGGVSRQEYWSELPCLPPRDLPNPEMELRYPALQVDSLPSEPPGKPH